MIIVSTAPTTPDPTTPSLPDGYSISGFPPGTPLCQWPLTLNGVALGVVDATGLEWIVQDVTGWESTAPLSGESSELSNADGSMAGAWWFGQREVVIAGQVETPNPGARFAAEVALQRSVGRGSVLLAVQDELPRQATVRLNGRLEVKRVSKRRITFEIPLIAHDPALYATSISTFTAPIPGGGQPTVPHEVPHAVSSSTLTRTATNEGTATAWPKFTLQGPLPEQVSFGNPATGEQMTLRDRQRPGQPLLQAGEWLTVETHPRVRRVLLFDDPQASRRGWLSGPNLTGDSPWWGFAPGVTTVTVSASAASGVSGDQISAEWRSCWL